MRAPDVLPVNAGAGASTIGAGVTTTTGAGAGGGGGAGGILMYTTDGNYVEAETGVGGRGAVRIIWGAGRSFPSFAA